MVNSKSGLNSAVYERTTNGKTEYAYVFAGTDMSEYNDVKADVKQAYGFGEGASLYSLVKFQIPYHAPFALRHWF